MPNDEPREGKPKTHLVAAVANLKKAATKPNAATYLHGAVAELIEHLLILQDRRDSAGGEGELMPPHKDVCEAPASDGVEELRQVIWAAHTDDTRIPLSDYDGAAEAALRWFHSRQPARGENRHEGKAAANDLAERDELRQESARPVHDGGSGQSKPTLVRNDVPLPTLAQGFLNVETREVILGASGPYSPQWVEFVAVPLDTWHAASHKHLDALLSPRGDGWEEAKAVTEAFRELNNAIACVSSPEYGRLCNAFHALHEAVRLSRPAAKEPLRVPIDPVYPKNSVEEREYWDGCVRRDLALGKASEWNLDRLTESFTAEIGNWKNRYDQACIEIERLKRPEGG